MIRLSSATRIANEDREALVSARTELHKLLGHSLPVTTVRHIKTAIAEVNNLLLADRPDSARMARVADAMKKVATDAEVYPLPVRERRIEELQEKYHSREGDGIESEMPIVGEHKVVEIEHQFRDEPQNRAGLTRSPLAASKVAENIMVYLDHRLYPNAQEGFDGWTSEGGPYYQASFDQKKHLAQILRSYGFKIDFDEDACWRLDNERRKGNKHPSFRPPCPKDKKLPLAQGQLAMIRKAFIKKLGQTPSSKLNVWDPETRQKWGVYLVDHLRRSGKSEKEVADALMREGFSTDEQAEIMKASEHPVEQPVGVGGESHGKIDRLSGGPENFIEPRNAQSQDGQDGQEAMDEVPTEDIIAFETGELDDNGVLRLFSKLIKTGIINHLQGHYGRTAVALMKDGWISKEGNVLKWPNETREAWKKQAAIIKKMQAYHWSPQQKEAETKKAKDIVNEMAHRGFNYDDVLKALVQNGWKESDANAFLLFEWPMDVPSEQKRQMPAVAKKKKIRQVPHDTITHEGDSIAIPGGPPGSSPSGGAAAGGGAAAKLRLSSFVATAQEEEQAPLPFQSR